MRIVVLSSIVAALPSELVPLSLAHCAEWNEEVRRLMGSEIMNAVTIYEMNGIKYTGAQKIYITYGAARSACGRSLTRGCF
jgi:hypothetical protein